MTESSRIRFRCFWRDSVLAMLLMVFTVLLGCSGCPSSQEEAYRNRIFRLNDDMRSALIRFEDIEMRVIDGEIRPGSVMWSQQFSPIFSALLSYVSGVRASSPPESMEDIHYAMLNSTLTLERLLYAGHQAGSEYEMIKSAVALNSFLYAVEVSETRLVNFCEWD
ncbi:MAG: hypothetical protein OXI33_01650 [Chloroflexota bacterium]|nr:hypothetical protein [Chloroflexota bacterium]